MRPKYKHDCQLCKFLGRAIEHDMYFCNQSGIGPTLVARYGSEGHDYHSTMAHIQSVTALTIAKQMAIKKGFL